MNWEGYCNTPSRWIDVRLRASLRSLALVVARRPYLWLCLPFGVAMCFASGIPLLRSESSYHKLWYPQNTPQYKELERFWDRFGFDNRTQIILVRTASGGAYDDDTGILAQAALEEVLQIQEALVAADLTVKRNGKMMRYEEVCVRAWTASPCILSSLLELWGSSSATLAEDNQSDILAKVNDRSALVTSYGSSMYLPSVLGSTVYAGAEGGGSTTNITGAGALQIVFQVDQKHFDAEEEHDAARDFESAFAAAAAELQQASVDLELFYFTASSFQLESDKAIADDQVFVTYAMVLMVLYVSAMLGRCDPVHSKVLLSLSIIVTIMLSLLFAFGMSGFLGYPLTQLSLMSIFILLGVGVDDMFILVDAWDRAAVAEQGRSGEPEGLGNERWGKEGAVAPTAQAEEAKGAGIKVEGGTEEALAAAVEATAMEPQEDDCFNWVEIISFRQAEELRGGEQDQDQEGDEARAVAGEEVGEEVGASEVSSSVGLERRLAWTYGEVGPSIVLTSLTDFTAFMIGSTISVPAISGFCKVAGMSVLAVFAIQLTFFGAALVLDERRVQANRLDVCACIASPLHDSSSSSSAAHVGDLGNAGGGSKKGAIREGLANFMRSLAGFVLRPRTAIVVVLMFLAVDLTLGLFAIQRVEVGADWSNFLPKGSHLLDFYDARDVSG